MSRLARGSRLFAFSSCVLVSAFCGAAPLPEVGVLPAEYQERLVRQLALAEENRGELLAAVRAVKPGHREALAFLIANMPLRDLHSLKARFLTENVELACKAREEVIWGASVPRELFLNYVLPYANLNERRDDWRKDFYHRFMGIAKQCRTPGETAVRLNKEMFLPLKVEYHPVKRPKPDQSPYESIQAGYASCTGLSILLVDACRAIGVPARVVGTPRWENSHINHTWVEVWDGHWHFMDAAYGRRELDRTWWFAGAKPEHYIYAASFRQTGTFFPLTWDSSVRYVPADDVTGFYTNRRTTTFRLVGRQDGKPVKAELTIRLKGKIVAADTADGAFIVPLAGGQTYDVQVQPLHGGKAVEHPIALPDKDDQTIDIPM